MQNGENNLPRSGLSGGPSAPAACLHVNRGEGFLFGYLFDYEIATHPHRDRARNRGAAVDRRAGGQVRAVHHVKMGVSI